MAIKSFLVACSLLIASLSFAQKQQETPAGKKVTSGSVPTVKLTFVEETDAPKVAASLAVYGPWGCSPDGAVFLQTASPSDLGKIELSSIGIVGDSYSANSFSLETMSDLHDAMMLI